jgi:hypothetical protein
MATNNGEYVVVAQGVSATCQEVGTVIKTLQHQYWDLTDDVVTMSNVRT